MNKTNVIKLPTDKQPTVRIRTRPNDANQTGDIFGGWLMSQIDVAAAIAAADRSKGPVVTVAVKELTFLKPLFVYDLVSFYAEVTSVGRTSINVSVEVYSQRNKKGYNEEAVVKISDAKLVFVAVSEPGKPRVVPTE